MEKRYGERIALRLLIFILGMMIAACSSSRQTGSRGSDAKNETAATSQIDESFDPVLLQDEDIQFSEKNMSSQKAEMPLVTGEMPENQPEAANRVMDGFRVQIFATQNIETATLQKKEAEFVFGGDSVAVYIEFDSPMYKIRVGDCLNRADAENLRETARRHGYPTSFVVKSKVNTLPLLPGNENTLFDDQ
jgi:hypothetical protein